MSSTLRMVKESMKNNNHLILWDELLVTFAVHDRMNDDFVDFVKQNQDFVAYLIHDLT